MAGQEGKLLRRSSPAAATLFGSMTVANLRRRNRFHSNDREPPIERGSDAGLRWAGTGRATMNWNGSGWRRHSSTLRRSVTVKAPGEGEILRELHAYRMDGRVDWTRFSNRDFHRRNAGDRDCPMETATHGQLNDQAFDSNG